MNAISNIPAPQPVVFERDGKVFANSRDVADFFGKLHKNVLQAIDSLECSASFTQLNFQPSTYTDASGRSLRCVDMTKDGFAFLVMGFTGRDAARFKEAYIQQFNNMEAALKNPLAGFAIPQSLSEALRLAADQADTIAQQRQQLAAVAPKAEGFDRISGAEGSLCITDAAKALQMRRSDLFDWLKQRRWIYSRPGKQGWLAYQDKIQTGYLEHKVTTVSRPDGSEKVTENVRVTPKGLAKLALVVPGANGKGTANLHAAE